MLKNLKIYKKLIFGYGFVVIPIVIAIITGILGFSTISKNIKNITETLTPSAEACWSIRINMSEILNELNYSVDSSDSSEIQESLNRCKTAVDSVVASFRELAAMMPEFKAEITDAIAEAYAVEETVNQIYELALENTGSSSKEATGIIRGTFNEAYTGILDLVNPIIDTVSKESDNISASTLKGCSIYIIVMIALCPLCAYAFINTTVIITRRITRPLKEVETAANNISHGILDAEIVYESKDELGRLTEAMRNTVANLSLIIRDTSDALQHIAIGDFQVEESTNFIGDFSDIKESIDKITSSLSGTMGSIKRVAQQVNSGADQVSNGAQALAQGATEQAGSIEELSATINDIYTKVRENAKNADDTKEVVGVVSAELLNSNQRMTDLVGAMDEITISSNEISKIIKAIEDIAFQTNILALNAAVEAARAGSAGKGFAVVADEVRNLASKSAEAAKDTAILIENSIQSVQKGSLVVDETAKALQNVVSGSDQIVELVDRISEKSNEQAVALGQVTQGIDQISAVVQTNSATAEESAAASEELNGQSSMLEELVEQFKLCEKANE